MTRPPSLAAGALPALLVVAAASPAAAQVLVRDSLGAPVPHAILETPSGTRLVTGADGRAPTAARSAGPWSARRIGFRPGTDDDGDGIIILARAPLALPVQYVAADGPCTSAQVASRSPDDVLRAVRVIFEEGDARREIASAFGASIPFRITTRLVTASGDSLDGGTRTERFPIRPPGEPFVAGRVIEKRGDKYIFIRPGLRDLASPVFLGAHCLSVRSHEDSRTTAIRFEPISGAPGSQVIGTFVIERASGRIVSDTIQYLGAPRGAPQQAVDVATYPETPDATVGIAVPARLVNRFEPHELLVRLPSGRQKVVLVERVLERLPQDAPP